MACMKLGSKSDVLRLEGQTWVCSSGLASDVTIEVGDFSFQLHKFPLISRSGLLEKRIGEHSSEDGSRCVVNLDDIPGGAKAFELVAKFCYGMKLELNALNLVSLRCASEFLQMSEDYGEGNLISQTELFSNAVFSSWADSMRALESCEEVLPYAEEAHMVSRFINSLAMKACSDPTLFSWPVSSAKDEVGPKENGVLWNGISGLDKSEPVTDDWWYEDVSALSFPLYKRLIKGVESRGMKPERVSGSIMHYVKRNLPVTNTHLESNDTNKDTHENTCTTGSNPTPSEANQRSMLEELVGLIPVQRGVTQTKFLLRMLRSAMILHASEACRANLERRIGAQLDQASLMDLLIPNMEYSTETLYDIDCVQRIIDHFMSLHHGVSGSSSPSIVEEGQLVRGSQSIGSITVVAELVDSYLAEVAPDVNLKAPKFQSLAGVVPDYARPRYDGIYHAIDTYLKAHPWMTELEREQICRLMNCQKLSLEASTHAAQNERLPLRVVVQVLFFEQLRLRTQISGWFFVSDNLDNSNSRTRDEAGEDRALVLVGDVKERVFELEKECISMRLEIQKLGKTKRRWSLFSRMFARPKTRAHSFIESKLAKPKAPNPAVCKKQDSGEVVD